MIFENGLAVRAHQRVCLPRLPGSAFHHPSHGIAATQAGTRARWSKNQRYRTAFIGNRAKAWRYRCQTMATITEALARGLPVDVRRSVLFRHYATIGRDLRQFPRGNVFGRKTCGGTSATADSKPRIASNPCNKPQPGKARNMPCRQLSRVDNETKLEPCRGHRFLHKPRFEITFGATKELSLEDVLIFNTFTPRPMKTPEHGGVRSQQFRRLRHKGVVDRHVRGKPSRVCPSEATPSAIMSLGGRRCFVLRHKDKKANRVNRLPRASVTPCSAISSRKNLVGNLLTRSPAAIPIKRSAPNRAAWVRSRA